MAVACGVVDGDVDTVVADPSRAALLAITRDAVTDLAETGQLLDIDVDQVARCLALVALNWRLGVQVSQPTQAQPVQDPRHSEERSSQEPGDMAQIQALMPELHGALQVLRIERPPLGAADTASSGNETATCRRSGC
jgi:hypothetical protein